MNRGIRSILITLSLVFIFGFESFANTEEQFVDYYQKATANQLTYLPEFLKEKKKNCILYSNEEYKKCLGHAINHAEEVLSCPQSLVRFQQGIEYDSWFARETFLQNKKEEVPLKIKSIFNKMVKNINSLVDIKFPIRFSIQAYQSSVRNAHAAIDGKIFISSGLWQTEPQLNENEIAAILAHEIAHVIKGHGAQLNCMALEWTSSKMTIKEAQATFNEEIRGSVRYEKWSEFSQKIELEADKIATFILKRTGLNPALMAQALIKLRPKHEGFSSGSHPDFEKRVKLALEASKSL